MRKRYLYSFPLHGGVPVTSEHGLCEITDDNWVIEADGTRTPLEDFGDYILTKEPTKYPYTEWVNLAGMERNK